MYDLELTTSHAQPQSDIETRDITIGALLREVAAAESSCPDVVSKYETPPGSRTGADVVESLDKLENVPAERSACGGQISLK